MGVKRRTILASARAALVLIFGVVSLTGCVASTESEADDAFVSPSGAVHDDKPESSAERMEKLPARLARPKTLSSNAGREGAPVDALGGPSCESCGPEPDPWMIDLMEVAVPNNTPAPGPAPKGTGSVGNGDH
jgi:hypothetical protein